MTETSGLHGTVDLFGKKFKKQTVLLSVGGVFVGVVGIGYYRNKKAASAASAANAATTTANEIDPATGFPYGSAEDSAALAGQNANIGLGGQLGAGQVIGYDGSGNPIYATGTSNAPLGFTSNAQWAQAAEQYMGSNGSDSIAAAIAKYVNSSPLTTDQVTIVQEAIASEGYPPVAGPGGYPPSYQAANVPPPTQGGGSTVKVPNVVGERKETAEAKIKSSGLVYASFTKIVPGKEMIVTGESPKANTSVPKGSTVTVTLKVG